jgi:pyrroloquinoline-quinone synthase
MRTAWSKVEFISRLRVIGTENYHHRHPFHKRMNAGELSPNEIRTWVENRFYYQKNIPIKDAAILSNCPLQSIRRTWLHRIIDHDGHSGSEGGIEAWVRLARACGVDALALQDDSRVLPGVRAAVDSYVEFAHHKPWPVAIASSLTELFAPDLMAHRLRAFETHYTWVAPEGFDYFRTRVTQARVDSDEALTITLQYCNTPELQQQAIDALKFKCALLWKILESIAAAPHERCASALRPKLSATARIQKDMLTGKTMLLFPEGAAVLNQTAQAIVTLCDGSRTVDAIVDELQAQFSGSRVAIEKGVHSSIQNLKSQGLLELSSYRAGATTEEPQ